MAKLNVASQVVQALQRFQLTKEKIKNNILHEMICKDIGLRREDMVIKANNENIEKRVGRKRRRRLNKRKRKDRVAWNPVCILNDLRPRSKYIKLAQHISNCSANINIFENKLNDDLLNKQNPSYTYNQSPLKVAIAVDGQNFIGFGTSFAKARQYAAQLALNYIFNKT